MNALTIRAISSPKHSHENEKNPGALWRKHAPISERRSSRNSRNGERRMKNNAAQSKQTGVRSNLLSILDWPGLATPNVASNLSKSDARAVQTMHSPSNLLRGGCAFAAAFSMFAAGPAYADISGFSSGTGWTANGSPP